jgi:hypothetical protein
MRTIYVYDPETKEMVVKGEIRRERTAPDIMPDLPDFVSSVDGRVINGRAGLRAHNKELGVTNPSDFTNHWANFQKKREALFSGQDKDPRRLQSVVRAFNTLEERNRNRRMR